MGRGNPQGGGVFGAYLAAQDTSPTLTLAHAGVNDDGALEIAHFLAGSRHLTRLDLTGNNLSSTGVFHISKALKQNYTLASLTLKHNRIGDLGEAGLASLCKALHANKTLRHLDLRHAGLQGENAATVIGEMLRSNNTLSHLELSWNPLDTPGGQVLCMNMQVNTTLFDCQLTGCGISDETLMSIAQLLLRNRKAKKADMQAGPFQALADDNEAALAPGAASVGIGGALAQSQFIASTGGNRPVASAEGDGADQEDLVARKAGKVFSNFLISSETTNGMMMRLAKFMQNPTTSAKDAALSQEMYDYLNKAQAQLLRDRDQVEGIHKHLEALSSGFRDRELRSRDSIAAGQDELMEVNREILAIRGIMERRSQDLALIREQNAQMHRDRLDDERQVTAEEALQRNRMSEIIAEKRELEKRLASVLESCQKQETDRAEMRKRADRLRQGVTLLHQPGRAGPFPETAR